MALRPRPATPSPRTQGRAPRFVGRRAGQRRPTLDRRANLTGSSSAASSSSIGGAAPLDACINSRPAILCNCFPRPTAMTATATRAPLNRLERSLGAARLTKVFASIELHPVSSIEERAPSRAFFLPLVPRARALSAPDCELGKARLGLTGARWPRRAQYGLMMPRRRPAKRKRLSPGMDSFYSAAGRAAWPRRRRRPIQATSPCLSCSWPRSRARREPNEREWRPAKLAERPVWAARLLLAAACLAAPT